MNTIDYFIIPFFLKYFYLSWCIKRSDWNLIQNVLSLKCLFLSLVGNFFIFLVFLHFFPRYLFITFISFLICISLYSFIFFISFQSIFSLFYFKHWSLIFTLFSILDSFMSFFLKPLSEICSSFIHFLVQGHCSFIFLWFLSQFSLWFLSQVFSSFVTSLSLLFIFYFAPYFYLTFSLTFCFIFCHNFHYYILVSYQQIIFILPLSGLSFLPSIFFDFSLVFLLCLWFTSLLCFSLTQLFYNYELKWFASTFYP